MRDIMARLRMMGQNGDVSVADVLSEFGATSFLPALIVPAFLVTSPLSGVPLFTTICGLTILIIASQMVFGRHYLWLPEFLTKRHVPGAKLEWAMDKTEWLGRLLDRMSRPRWHWLTSAPVLWCAKLVCMVCGAVMPFLEFIPFSSSFMGLSVSLIAIGLLARDGVFLIAGMSAACVGVSIPFFVASKIAEVV